MVNKQIIIAALIIAGSSVITNVTSNPPKPNTKVIMGAYVFLLMLSLLDLFGGSIAKIASSLAMLAVVYVLLNNFPWQQILNVVQGKKGK